METSIYPKKSTKQESTPEISSKHPLKTFPKTLQTVLQNNLKRSQTSCKHHPPNPKIQQKSTKHKSESEKSGQKSGLFFPYNTVGAFPNKENQWKTRKNQENQENHYFSFVSAFSCTTRD